MARTALCPDFGSDSALISSSEVDVKRLVFEAVILECNFLTQADNSACEQRKIELISKLRMKIWSQTPVVDFSSEEMIATKLNLHSHKTPSSRDMPTLRVENQVIQTLSNSFTPSETK